MLKVVIVDDESYVLNCMPQIFDWQSLGFEIAGLFNNVHDAENYIRSNHVDVVFADIMMPTENGFDIAAFCHKEYPNIKLVFISAFRNFEYAQKAFSYNIFDYLLKPITYETLFKVLERLKRHHSLSQMEQDSPLSTDSFDIVQLTRKYLNKNYAKEVSLSDVAYEIGLSPAYFSSLYKIKSGENFITTLNHIRIEHAKQLLLDRSIKVSHICNLVGYQSRAYFFRIFKDISGISPSEYRDQLKKNDK